MSISVILCLAYAPLTGGGAPVRRAAVAVALAATVSVSGRAPNGVSRRIDALTLWAAALVFECWLDPGAVCEVSVQLSYGATLGLILGTRPVAACLTRSLGVHLETAPRELLHGPWRACLAAWRRRAVRAGITGVAASLSAVCATAPVIWWTFGEACPWGVLTTPLLAPLFVLLFVSGMLMLLTPWAPLEVLFTGTGEALMEAMSFVDSLPGTPMLLPERQGWLVCGAVGLGWWVVGRTRPGLRPEAPPARAFPGRWPRLEPPPGREPGLRRGAGPALVGRARRLRAPRLGRGPRHGGRLPRPRGAGLDLRLRLPGSTAAGPGRPASLAARETGPLRRAGLAAGADTPEGLDRCATRTMG
ncbi:MAG: ComEC/Rec2 family competence protein [Planctomycetes bacterium]|nr:ComEC/Rec2 family competence protein [Planctomycetota bacterium]